MSNASCTPFADFAAAGTDVTAIDGVCAPGRSMSDAVRSDGGPLTVVA